MYNLQRFIDAQEQYYSTAISEIRRGKKTTHWMWFIFPQLKGLGSSYYSSYYGIESIEEARKYLANSYLYTNLRKITLKLLSLKSNNATEIMGYPDDLKLKSCMTLFYIASKQEIFLKVINKYFDGELDQNTIKLLKVRRRKDVKISEENNHL